VNANVQGKQLLIFYSLLLVHGREGRGEHSRIVTEDGLIHFEKRLHGDALGLHVSHFALNGLRPHNGWGKNHCEVERRHLMTVSKHPVLYAAVSTYKIFAFVGHNLGEMEDQEFETVSMAFWQRVDGISHGHSALIHVFDL
jgi:hypothetical protein